MNGWNNVVLEMLLKKRNKIEPHKNHPLTMYCMHTELYCSVVKSTILTGRMKLHHVVFF